MFRTIELDYPINPRPRYGPAAPHPGLKRLLDTNKDAFARLLRGFNELAPQLGRIARGPLGLPPGEPCWGNDWLPPLDALCIYGLLAQTDPEVFFEVGSGNSTKFARRAIRDFGLRTRIVSVDPEPRAEVDALCDELHRTPFEELDPAVYAGLGRDALIFIDNSHRCFQNSDATVVFLELLPSLGEGARVGLHDIFLPHDYPADWAERFYSEQYLLAAFLLGGGGGFDVLLPGWYVSHAPELMACLDSVWAEPALAGLFNLGSAFWLQRRADGPA